MSGAPIHARKFTCDYEPCGLSEVVENLPGGQHVPDGWFEIPELGQRDREPSHLPHHTRQCLVLFIDNTAVERREGNSVVLSTVRWERDTYFGTRETTVPG